MTDCHGTWNGPFPRSCTGPKKMQEVWGLSTSSLFGQSKAWAPTRWRNLNFTKSPSLSSTLPILVRHMVNSIIFILTDALWWYWLQHVEAQLTDHYLPKHRNARIRHHLCFVNQPSCKKAHKNPTIISIRLLWYFTVLICLKLPLLGVNWFVHSLQKPHNLFNWMLPHWFYTGSSQTIKDHNALLFGINNKEKPVKRTLCITRN